MFYVLCLIFILLLYCDCVTIRVLLFIIIVFFFLEKLYVASFQFRKLSLFVFLMFLCIVSLHTMAEMC